MLPNLPPKKRIENRLSQEVEQCPPPLYLQYTLPAPGPGVPRGRALRHGRGVRLQHGLQHLRGVAAAPGYSAAADSVTVRTLQSYSCSDESPAAAPAEKKPSFVLWNAWTDNCRGRSEEEEGEGLGVGGARIKQEAGDLEEADRNSEEEGGGGISTVHSHHPPTLQ